MFRQIAGIATVLVCVCPAWADFCSDMSAINTAAKSNFSELRGQLISSDRSTKVHAVVLSPTGAKDCQLMQIEDGAFFYSCWWPLTSANKKEAVTRLLLQAAKCFDLRYRETGASDADAASEYLLTETAEFQFRSGYADKEISMLVSSRQ